MSDQPCRDEDCERDAEVGPWCPGHAIARYKRQAIRPAQYADDCSSDGCVRLAKYGDRCSRHRVRSVN